MATLFIDIQTIPSQNPKVIDDIASSVKPPAQYKNDDSIARWYRENLKNEIDKKLRQTALDGLYGEVFSIAWALGDGNITVFWRDEHAGERGLLEHFMLELAALEDENGPATIDCWAGHNILEFDLPFLWQRCVALSVKPAQAIPIDAAPFDARVFDTRLAWVGRKQQHAESNLEALSRNLALGGEALSDSNRVYDHWLAGRYRQIADHNRLALSRSRALYRRLRFQASGPSD